MGRYAAAISQHPDPMDAVAEVVAQVSERLEGAPELAVLFVAGQHIQRIGQIASTVQALLNPSAFIGSSAGAVLANGQGAEDVPAISLWVGQLHGRSQAVHLDVASGERGWQIAGFDEARASESKTLILLPDPFSFPTSEFLAQLALDHPHLAAVGGLASSGRAAGDNALVIGGRVIHSGAVGVLLEASCSPDTVVSQGCRPIGQPWTVTKSDRNVIYELGGRLALDRVMEIIASLEPGDRKLASEGLHCGIVANEHQLDFARGDFLIRAVLGADRKVGAVVVGDQIDVGATVQFQVRDAETAGEDLRELLAGRDSSGALVFTCNGRGTSMFGNPHHDAEILHEYLGQSSAIAGMFCGGEIGPVAGRNALHGFTASIALFG
jgi:small ligand-binding sensory domain FIST